MKKEHKDLREESHRSGQGGQPAKDSPPDRGSYSNSIQEAARPGSPYRGRPTQQGRGSRRSTPREREDTL